MFVTQLQKALTYIRETQGMALFFAMARPNWLAGVQASPLFYALLPFIGLLLTLSALINGYQLAKSNNRNLDQWFLFISSIVCATLACISLYGSALSLAFGFSFALSPWFFLSSLVGTLSYQLGIFGLNLYRTLESPIGSIQRVHYTQSVLASLFAITLSTVAIGAFVLVLLTPIAPIIGSACAITATTLTFLNILWRTIPHNGKQMMKGWLHLGKPDLTEDATVTQKQILKPKDSITLEDTPQHQRLFTHNDYSAIIRQMDKTEARKYLIQRIQQKLSTYAQNMELQDKKIKDKMSLLNELVQAIESRKEISKKKMLAEHPLAFQSFWAEKGEVEQLFDAVVVFQDKYQSKVTTAPALSIL